MKKLSVIVMGCGNRGSNYARHMATMPEQYRVVGAADPDSARLAKMRNLHNIPAENCYSTYQEIRAFQSLPYRDRRRAWQQESSLSRNARI